MPQWGKRSLRRVKGVGGPARAVSGLSSFTAHAAIRCERSLCLWRVAGHEVPVKAVVASVEG